MPLRQLTDVPLAEVPKRFKVGTLLKCRVLANVAGVEQGQSSRQRSPSSRRPTSSRKFQQAKTNMLATGFVWGWLCSDVRDCESSCGGRAPPTAIVWWLPCDLSSCQIQGALAGLCFLFVLVCLSKFLHALSAMFGPDCQMKVVRSDTNKNLFSCRGQYLAESSLPIFCVLRPSSIRFLFWVTQELTIISMLRPLAVPLTVSKLNSTSV